MNQDNAQLSAAEEADHQAMRDLRDAFASAYNRADIESMLSYLDANVAFTAMNGEVAHGHPGVRAYHDRLLGGPNPLVKGATVDALEADQLTTIYSGTFGVVTGWADTSYKLADGLSFSARVRWSITMTKHSGSWKIASLHTSTNIFDNPILTMSKKAGRYAATATAALGLAVGGAVVWLLRRR
jgi:ketosteroid isomerase-like protein